MDDAGINFRNFDMKIAFRTDASLQIGTGHVMRCLTLACALRKDGADCEFITRAHSGNLAARIKASGFEVSLLPAPRGPLQPGPPTHAHWAGVDWAQDAAETRAALGDAPEWLIVDHYAFDARWQRAALPAGAQLMVIDDLADRPHACDLLLDQNLGRKTADYDGLLPDHCTRLIGPQYALLRPEFAAIRTEAVNARSGRGLKNLLISMGGVDAIDATSTVLNALQSVKLPPDIRITVIMGGQAPALERIKAKAKTLSYPTEVVIDVVDMPLHIQHADLAIGAGGSTTWERACLGLPSILVQIADNQAGIVEAMIEANAALTPGPLTSLDFTERLGSTIAKAQVNLDAIGHASALICDGGGLERVKVALSCGSKCAGVDRHHAPEIRGKA